MPVNNTARRKFLVVMVLAAISAGLIDNLIPRPVPFMKFGLANTVILFLLITNGFVLSFKVNVLRIVTVSLFTGSIFTPSFVFSLTGGLFSLIIMKLATLLTPRYISIPGVSITGAIASLYSQLAVAVVLIPGLPVERLVLPVTCWGIISGSIVGIVTVFMLRNIMVKTANNES